MMLIIYKLTPYHATRILFGKKSKWNWIKTILNIPVWLILFEFATFTNENDFPRRIEMVLINNYYNEMYGKTQCFIWWCVDAKCTFPIKGEY